MNPEVNLILNWLFWRGKGKQQGEALQEQLVELGEQLSKLTRLQYKTGQDIQSKIDRVGDSLESVKKDFAYSQKDQLLIEALVGWLDDLDYATASLRNREEEQKAWKQLMERWTQQLLITLASLGVREVDVLGHSYEPRLAESVQTVSWMEWRESTEGFLQQDREPAPYEVVSIISRGFWLPDSTLFRKAKVITLKEEKLGND